MPTNVNLRNVIPTIRKPLSRNNVNPAESTASDNSNFDAPLTEKQAKAQNKSADKDIHECVVMVDSTSYVIVKINKWVKAWFDVQRTPAGNMPDDSKSFYVQLAAKKRGSTAKKSPIRNKKSGDSKSPGGIRGMRKIYLPLNEAETFVKDGDLANHPAVKRKVPAGYSANRGIQYLSMRVPACLNHDAIAYFIKTQFKANTPKVFYTEKNVTVIIPQNLNLGDLGKHPALV